MSYLWVSSRAPRQDITHASYSSVEARTQNIPFVEPLPPRTLPLGQDLTELFWEEGRR